MRRDTPDSNARVPRLMHTSLLTGGLEHTVTTGSAIEGVPQGPPRFLDLTNEADREAYHTLLLFQSYLGDLGIRAALLRVIALELYGKGMGMSALPEGSDAESIRDELVRDVAGASTGLNLGTLVGGLFGAISTLMSGTSETDAPEPTEQSRSTTYDLETGIAESAVGLSQLMEYVRKLPAHILPMEARPSAEFVSRCLEIFHAVQRERSKAKLADAVDNPEPGPDA